MKNIKNYIKENPILKYFLPLSSVFFLSYMFLSIPATYLPLYLSSKGLSSVQIGLLLSLVPFSAIAGQFFWGNAADKSKSKTKILMYTIILSLVISPIFLLANSFLAFFLLILVLFFCQSSTAPLSDAIAFEYAINYGIKYNPIRLIGTMGFAIMTVIAGFVAVKSINYIFIIYSLTALITIIPLLFCPIVVGHRKKGQKFNTKALFLKKDFVAIFLFSMIINITYGFHTAFFSIYFSNTLNAGTALLGIVTLLCTLLEFPFLFFADKFLKKVSIKPALLFFGFLCLIRWVVYASTSSLPLIIFFSIFQGISIVGINYYLAYYIANSSPPEGKATSQMFNAILNFGIARFIGCIGGGFLLPVFGMKNIYSFCAIIVFIVLIVFSIVKVDYKKIIRKNL